jgi:hypothetical protein
MKSDILEKIKLAILTNFSDNPQSVRLKIWILNDENAQAESGVMFCRGTKMYHFGTFGDSPIDKVIGVGYSVNQPIIQSMYFKRYEELKHGKYR